MAESGVPIDPNVDRAKKLEEAKKLKEEGNEFFKNKTLRKAIGKYHRSILYIKAVKQNKCGLPFAAFMAEFNGGDTPIDESILKDALKLEVDCYNNLSACLLMTTPPNYEKILQYCDQVLEIDPNSTKALYRRGVSLYHLKNVDAAMESLNKAKTHGGGKDPKVKQYIDLCQQEIERQERKMKATYKGMFDKMAEKENGETS